MVLIESIKVLRQQKSDRERFATLLMMYEKTKCSRKRNLHFRENAKTYFRFKPGGGIGPNYAPPPDSLHKSFYWSFFYFARIIYERQPPLFLLVVDPVAASGGHQTQDLK
jgi:hypothetical protein